MEFKSCASVSMSLWYTFALLLWASLLRKVRMSVNSERVIMKNHTTKTRPTRSRRGRFFHLPLNYRAVGASRLTHPHWRRHAAVHSYPVNGRAGVHRESGRLVSRFRSSPEFSARSDANFGIE